MGPTDYNVLNRIGSTLAVMETHIGREVGKFIENELFLASKSVFISSPAISYNLGIRILELLERGIKLKIITSNSGAADSEKMNLYMKNFMRSTTYLESINKKKYPPLEYKIVSSKEVALIHAKIYIVDDKCAIIGSANLTENSFHNFAEYIVIIRNKEEIDIVRNDYNTLWNSFHDSEIDEPSTKKNVKDIIRKVRRKF